MKFRNSFEARAQLRREQFNRGQRSCQFKGKSSLNKRIIAERCKGITADNIDKQTEKLALQIEIDNMLAQILYHIRFCRNSYPATFNDEVIEGVIENVNKLEKKFKAAQIDEKGYVEGLKSIDDGVMNVIKNWEQCL